MCFCWRQANTVLKPDASSGCALVCPEVGVLYPLESLTALNSTDLEAEAAAAERGDPFSVFSVPSVASVVQSPYIMAVIGKLKTYVDKPVARCYNHTKQAIGGDL